MLQPRVLGCQPTSDEASYPEPRTTSVPINDVSDLIGREAESEVLDAVVDQLHVRGGALIVRGEAGIGKSALLGRARERVAAMGGRVLSTVAVELEDELAFAGLHQLLHPLSLVWRNACPKRRRAIDAAFGVSAALERTRIEWPLRLFSWCVTPPTGASGADRRRRAVAGPLDQRHGQWIALPAGRIGQRTPDSRDRLSAQELQIAQLAAEGLRGA